MNRVGHAFFKTRMREENAAFGGEVSGHYYFRDFWYADSGMIPALLVLELLSKRGKPMSELLEPYRSSYFISGEINSEVADQDAKMEELSERYSDGEVDAPRRRLGRLRQLALQRSPVEHRTAAAAEPGGLEQAGDGGAHRRGPAGHPRVSEAPDPSSQQALDAGGQGGHPLPSDPDPVRRRQGQHLSDRGRSAHARRLRSQLRQGAGRASAPARRARALDRRHRAGGAHPPAHRPPRPGRHHRQPLGRRGRRDRQARRASPSTTPTTPRKDDEFATRRDAAQRHPRGDRAGIADGVVRVPQLGRTGEGHEAAA